MATFNFKATDRFSGLVFPAMAVRGVLYDSYTGERVTIDTHPFGVTTEQITAEEFIDWCDQLGLNT